MDYTWKSDSKGEILISDMDDEHLRNAISMIKRGFDRFGRSVDEEHRRKLPLLLEERRKRILGIPMIREKVVTKKDKKYDYVDVKFAGNPERTYTYKVRKGAKCYLGQSLVVENESGTKVVFVVGINTGRSCDVSLKEIFQKVVRL